MIESQKHLNLSRVTVVFINQRFVGGHKEIISVQAQGKLVPIRGIQRVRAHFQP